MNYDECITRPPQDTTPPSVNFDTTIHLDGCDDMAVEVGILTDEGRYWAYSLDYLPEQQVAIFDRFVNTAAEIEGATGGWTSDIEGVDISMSSLNLPEFTKVVLLNKMVAHHLSRYGDEMVADFFSNKYEEKADE